MQLKESSRAAGAKSLPATSRPQLLMHWAIQTGRSWSSGPRLSHLLAAGASAVELLQLSRSRQRSEQH